MRQLRKHGLAVAIVIVFVAVMIGLALRYRSSTSWFVEEHLPLRKPYRLFDTGVADVNGDNLLDIYTSNHHFRQQLLIANGDGSYHDALSDWGLDQSTDFPGAELSLDAPKIDDSGLYIYWFSTKLVIRTHGGAETEPWRGSLSVNDAIKIVKNNGFEIEQTDHASRVSTTTMEFSAGADGELVLKPSGQGLPVHFQVDGGGPLDHIYVGAAKVSPRSPRFSLAMQDRHALAWADYNDDGMLDVFITRGALGGMLRAYPEEIQRTIKDEFLLSGSNPRYSEIVSGVGVEKNGCSGRHARWLDFNHDGLLDLYINCYDRQQINGTYPKQLYQQDSQGHLHGIAGETGADMPDQQIGSLVWIDIDNDGDVDLVTFQDDGIFIDRNDGGRLFRETAQRRQTGSQRTIGSSNGEWDRWLFDGKLSVSDYDSDGDLDLFSASKHGNSLLVNIDGSYAPIDPESVGLPRESITANWVDYDNDGLPDLHIVPQGMFRQRTDHSFEETGLLALPREQYVAAICNWFDRDNDGRQDLLMVVSANRTFKHWWEFFKKPFPISDWTFKTYRNVGSNNHWLQVKLIGPRGNPQGIGSQVSVITPNSQQVQEVGSTDGAFFSQGHYRLYFGLGSHDVADAVNIRWSDGCRQEIKDVIGDRLLVIDVADGVCGRLSFGHDVGSTLSPRK